MADLLLRDLPAPPDMSAVLPICRRRGRPPRRRVRGAPAEDVLRVDGRALRRAAPCSPARGRSRARCSSTWSREVAPRHAGGRVRHRPALPRDVRDAREADRALSDQVRAHRAGADRRASRRPSHGDAAVGARSRRLLRHAQGRAARAGAATGWTPGSREFGGNSRQLGKVPARSSWTNAAAWSRSSHWPTGRAATSGATSGGTAFPYNPLHDHGYPSIGCMPCTTPVDGSVTGRAGGQLARHGQGRVRPPRQLDR